MRALLFTLALGGIVQARAQTLGIEIIPQQVWMYNRSDAEEGSLFDYVLTNGLAGGASFTYYDPNRSMGCTASLLISRQGQRFSSYVYQGGSTFTGNKRNTYLKVPLLFCLQVLHDRLRLSFGPQVSILLIAAGATVSYSESISGYPYYAYNLIQARREYYRPVLFDMAAGVARSFPFRERYWIEIGFRADYSLSDAENKDATVVYANGVKSLVYYIEDEPRASTHNITYGIRIAICRRQGWIKPACSPDLHKSAD